MVNDLKFEIFYKKFQEIMDEFGEKSSSAKIHILKILYSHKEQISAQEIKKEIFLKYKEKISITTIYKFLKFLFDLNLLTYITQDKINKYSFSLDRKNNFLICIKCNKTIRFDDEVLNQKYLKIFKKFKYDSYGSFTILYGICKDCL